MAVHRSESKNYLQELIKLLKDKVLGAEIGKCLQTTEARFNKKKILLYAGVVKNQQLLLSVELLDIALEDLCYK